MSTEVEEFHHQNFIMGSMQLESIAPLMKLISLLLDMIQVEIEDLVQVNLMQLSLLMMVMLTLKFAEDHQIIRQDHLEEMIASQDQLLQKIVQCGEPILGLKMQLKVLDKDLLPDQALMLMKHLILLI